MGSHTSDGYHRGRHFRFSYRRLKIHFADQKQLIYCREDICWPRKNTDFHTITPLKSIYTPCQSKQQANERLQEILPATGRIYSSPWGIIIKRRIRVRPQVVVFSLFSLFPLNFDSWPLHRRKSMMFRTDLKWIYLIEINMTEQILCIFLLHSFQPACFAWKLWTVILFLWRRAVSMKNY